MPLEFETELFAVPDSELRLVGARRKDRLAISGRRDAVACLWELEILDELDTIENFFVLEGSFALLALV